MRVGGGGDVHADEPSGAEPTPTRQNRRNSHDSCRESSRSSAGDWRPGVTTSHLEPTSMPRRRSRLGLRHPWPAAAWVLLAGGGVVDRGRGLGLLDRALVTADALGMAAVAEGIRTLQAAQPAQPGQAVAAVAAGNVFRREGEYWTVIFDGVVVRLRDAKGLRHLARLLAHPGREFHALDLEAAQGPPGPVVAGGPGGRGGGGELAVRPDLGDAGVLLDAAAKAAYRARLGELEAEVEEAEAGNDPGRVARARQEREFLGAEWARAVGVGGRDRGGGR